MKTPIESIIGKDVTIESFCYENPEDGRGVEFSLNGKLEDHEEGFFYVRVKECYNGSSGVSFKAARVHEIERMPSGRVVITLKA